MNEKCSFSPRVQVVRPSATITTSSKDPILHTTQCDDRGRQESVQRGGAGTGHQIAKILNTPPGLVRLICNTHPWMRGYIVRH